MKINITKKEYKALLDILAIADWVLTSGEVEEEPETEEYRKLEQRFFSYAKDFGCDNLIEHDPELGRYFPAQYYEETSKYRDLIDEYENHIFWNELIDRLVQRDLMRQEGGPENVMKMPIEERLKKEDLLEREYAAEFEENGLANIGVSRNRLTAH